MKAIYEPFVLKRLAEDRIFWVNGKMPFEFFIDCFEFENPFFLVAQLEDNRIAIVPNALAIPWNRLHEGFWPQDLLPLDYEYVTMKELTYPVIITAHPVAHFEEWLMKFEKLALRFVKQPLGAFVAMTKDYLPVRLEERVPAAKLRETVKA